MWNPKSWILNLTWLDAQAAEPGAAAAPAAALRPGSMELAILAQL